jgi:hypothetical protein
VSLVQGELRRCHRVHSTAVLRELKEAREVGEKTHGH